MGGEPAGLKVEIVGLANELAATERQAASLNRETQETSERLDQIEALLHKLESGDATCVDFDSSDIQKSKRATPQTVASFDELLSSAEARRIERRMTGGVSISAELDAYDVLAATAIGLIAAVADQLIAPVPSKGLTFLLRSYAMRSDNGLAAHAKVPYDRVANVGVDGLSGLTHRVQSPGHDPLFGLIFGTADILLGRATFTDAAGRVHFLDSPMAGAESVVGALTTQLAHLLSDLFTPCGLPVPGWSMPGAVPLEVGGVAVAARARSMYTQGYDSWHCMAMAVQPAAVELLLRAYWSFRCDEPGYAPNAGKVADHPRFEALSFVAHGVSTLANLSAVMISADVLALNWVQLMSFTREVVGRATHAMAVGDIVFAPARRNRELLDAGWTELWESFGAA